MQLLVHSSYAETTIEKRASLWARFKAWATSVGEPLTENAAALFLCALQKPTLESLQPQTLAGYAGSLRQVALQSGITWQGDILAEMAKIWRALSDESEQAVPALHSHIYENATSLLSCQKQELKDAAIIMILLWKGRMRWADAQVLLWEDIHIVNAELMVLDLLRAKSRGKAGRAGSDTRFVLVAGSLTFHIIAWLQQPRVRELTKPFTLLPVSAFLRITQEQLSRELSLHSFRVGALNHLVCLAAKGVEIDPQALRIASRHSGKVPKLPKVLVGYLRKSP